MPGAALLNGEPVATGAFSDRGLHFGDGLFETLAVINGVPCLWERHFLRLTSGCERLDLPTPDAALLLDEAQRLCSGVGRGVLKIILTAGPVERGYARSGHIAPSRWLQCSPWPSVSPYIDDLPLHLQLCRTRLGTQPRLAGIKHLNRLEQVLARNELRAPAHEGVVCNLRGEVVEGIASNLLARLDGTWRTPPLHDCGVAGVVRGMFLDAANDAGETVSEASMSVDELRRAEALFVSNSLLGIRRVARLDEHVYPATGGYPLIERVHAACFTAEGIA